MSVGALETLPALLLVDEELWSARFAHDDTRHLRAGDQRGTKMQTVVLADGEDLGQRHLRALLQGLLREALNTHDVALGDAHLFAPGPDHCVHGLPQLPKQNGHQSYQTGARLSKRASVFADLVRQLVRVRWPPLREKQRERLTQLVDGRHDAFREPALRKARARGVARLDPERVSHLLMNARAADHRERARFRSEEQEATGAVHGLVHAEPAERRLCRFERVGDGPVVEMHANLPEALRLGPLDRLDDL